MAKKNKKKIPTSVKEFSKTSLKRFKKESGYYNSQKELKEGWAYYLIDRLPETAEFLAKNGYISDDQIQEVKQNSFKQLNDAQFIKYLKKEIKKNGGKNFKFLPIVLREMLNTINDVNNRRLAENASARIFETDDIVEVIRLLTKKRMKKLMAAGVDEKLAFDLATVIPSKVALEERQAFYRIKTLNEVIYEHAKVVKVPYADIIDILIPKEYYLLLITFSLLERKEKFVKLTDSQKPLYLDINDWTLKTMESLNKDELSSVLKKYIERRKNDDRNGRDSARRFNLSSLPTEDYPKISSVVKKLTTEESSKYI